MTDVVNNVFTNFVVNDKATRPLATMAASVGRVDSLFNSVSRVVGGFGALAATGIGALSFGHMIKETQDTLDNIKKIQGYTKMSAESAGGLMQAMELAGMEGNEATGALMRMSRAGARMDMMSRGIRGNTRGMSREFHRLGIDISKGPEKAIYRMAVLAKRGEIDQAKVGRMLGLYGDSARKFTEMLKKGPEHLQKTKAEFAKLNIATQENVDRQARIKQLGREIKSSWNSILMIVGVKLLPVLEDMMGFVSNKLETWIPKAEEFGTKLADFLREHHRIVVNTGKVLMANFLLMKLTGAGVGGIASKGFGLATKLAGVMMGGAGMAGGGAAAGAGGAAAGGAAAAALAPVLAVLAAIAALVALIWAGWKAIKANTDGIRTALLELWGKIRVHFRMIYESIKPILIPLARLFHRSGPAGHFFSMLLPRMFKAYLTYVEGFLHVVRAVGAFLSALWPMAVQVFENLKSSFLDVWDTIAVYFDEWVVQPIVKAWQWIADTYDTYLAQPIATAWAKVAGFFKTYFIDPVQTALNAIFTWIQEKIRPWTDALEGMTFDLGWVQPTADMMMKAWRGTAVSAEEAAREVARMHQRQKEATKERPPAPYNDFRNSRFDITQKFAEGFDPDRIALAFTSDLAALGERKLQSGFSPLYAVR